MYTTKKIAYNRDAFTLVEMLVVIAIIMAVAALAAAFAPRVNDNQKLTRAVDNLEQWLLTAKMRAKRDGLATGLRFIHAQGDTAETYSQFQYIQQPEPLSGGTLSAAPQLTGVWVPAPVTSFPAGLYLNGGYIASAASGIVTFGNVDFSLGGAALVQGLVQTGDYLEINGGSVYYIGNVVPVTNPPATQLALGPLNPTPPPLTIPTAYDSALTILSTTPTTNYRILRQPRILIGEEPLTLPNNYAANFGNIPGTTSLGCNVTLGPNLIYPEILFSPTGAVIGTNAGTPILWISVWDTTMETQDPNRVGIVGIQSRSGFIGAYGVAPGNNPFYFVQTARQSGL